MVEKWKFIRIKEEVYNKLRDFAQKDSFSRAIELLLIKRKEGSALLKGLLKGKSKSKPDCFGLYKERSGICQDCFNKDECRVFTP